MGRPEAPLLGQLNAEAGLGAALLALALGGCAAVRVVETTPTPGERATTDRDTVARVRALGRDGDWLVIRGYHLTDHFVATVTNNPFSHAAVLDIERDRVIEAESKGIHFTLLADFVAKSHRLMLIRPVWSSGSFGVMPVCFAIRASIFGPISSPSWNAKTKSAYSARLSVRCDPMRSANSCAVGMAVSNDTAVASTKG